MIVEIDLNTVFQMQLLTDLDTKKYCQNVPTLLEMITSLDFLHRILFCIILWKLLQLVRRNAFIPNFIEPRQLVKCLEVVKSLLATLIGYWYTEGLTGVLESRTSAHFSETVRLVHMLKTVNFGT
jgi:hypothetical protein